MEGFSYQADDSAFSHAGHTALHRSMQSGGRGGGLLHIFTPPDTVLLSPVCFSDLHIPSAVRPGTSVLLHSDIKASRGVIPICFKGTINLPILRPDRREAL